MPPAASRAARCVEFKQMVKALHEAGIEVILDVVFNHTAEGNELGPTLSFKGLENHVYYMLGNGGSFYRNFTGCGNTINGNHPIVREMLFLVPAALGANLSRRRVPLRPGFDSQPRSERRDHSQSAGGRTDRRRSAVGGHQGDRRSVGCGRGVSGGLVRQSALGGMERPLSRRRAAVLARRPAHGRRRGHAAGRFGRFVSGRRAAAVSQHQLRHLARRLHAERSGDATPTSTTKTTAKGTATATTTTTAPITASKGPRGNRTSKPCASGRSRTSWPRCC